MIKQSYILPLLLAITHVVAFGQTVTSYTGTIKADKPNTYHKLLDWNRIHFFDNAEPLILAENNEVREVTGITVIAHLGDSLVKCAKILNINPNSDYFPGLWFNFMDSTGNFTAELIGFLKTTQLIPQIKNWSVTAECPNGQIITINDKKN